ncbi:hypothetical protein ACJMK2_040760, partial [Sinanodonta woodiana]
MQEREVIDDKDCNIAMRLETNGKKHPTDINDLFFNVLKMETFEGLNSESPTGSTGLRISPNSFHRVMSTSALRVPKQRYSFWR